MPRSKKFSGFELYWYCLPLTFIALMVLVVDADDPKNIWAPIFVVSLMLNMFPMILAQSLLNRIRQAQDSDKEYSRVQISEEPPLKNGSQSYEGVSRLTSDETNTKAPQVRKKFHAKALFVVPYEDMEGNLRRRWYGTMREAKKGHAWFKKAQRHGHAQNLYPPMEQLVPEIDACPANKSELVEELNSLASFEAK